MRSFGVISVLMLAGTLAGNGSLSAQAPASPPQVTISGVGYAQYQYLFSDDVGHGNNFDITRAYLTATGKFSNGVGTRVTTDIYHNGDGQVGVRLKYAFVSWAPDHSALTYRFGLTQTPWIDWEETLWDYRMQGPIAVDRNGYLTSSDYGMAVDGSWGKEKVNFQGGVYNGEGYSKPLGDKRKDASARLSVRLMETNDASKVGGLRLTGYGQIGAPTGGGTRDRFIGMLSYRDKQLTLAGEMAVTRDRDSLATATTNGQVVSTYAVFHIPNTKATLLGRVDMVRPTTAVANNRRTEFIGGASYQISPNLRVLADLDNTSYQGGFPSPAAQALHTQGLFQVQFSF